MYANPLTRAFHRSIPVNGLEISAKLDSSAGGTDTGIVSCVLLLATSVGGEDVIISCGNVTISSLEDVNGWVDKRCDTNSLEDGKIVSRSVE